MRVEPRVSGWHESNTVKVLRVSGKCIRRSIVVAGQYVFDCTVGWTEGSSPDSTRGSSSTVYGASYVPVTVHPSRSTARGCTNSVPPPPKVLACTEMKCDVSQKLSTA